VVSLDVRRRGAAARAGGNRHRSTLPRIFARRWSAKPSARQRRVCGRSSTSVCAEPMWSAASAGSGQCGVAAGEQVAVPGQDRVRVDHQP